MRPHPPVSLSGTAGLGRLDGEFRIPISLLLKLPEFSKPSSLLGYATETKLLDQFAIPGKGHREGSLGRALEYSLVWPIPIYIRIKQYL